MKELSIEEKATRYDEAITHARLLLKTIGNATLGNLVLKNEFKTMFPALEESEDEKIRKEILTAFSYGHDNSDIYGHGITYGQVRAWLEKQGEQKPTEFDDTNAKRMFIKALERVEEQNNKGYKLTDCDKNSWWEDFKTYTSRTIEQKPADKVEPKFKVKYAGSEYNVFETKNIADVTYYGIEDEPNHIDYVQAKNCERVDGYSIKESGSPFPTKPAKFSEQNSTWSEEDEKILNLIIARLHSHPNVEAEEYNKEYHWLKSLKDRYIWRPSDEQMKAFSAINVKEIEL